VPARAPVPNTPTATSVMIGTRRLSWMKAPPARSGHPSLPRGRVVRWRPGPARDLTGPVGQRARKREPDDRECGVGPLVERDAGILATAHSRKANGCGAGGAARSSSPRSIFGRTLLEPDARRDGFGDDGLTSDRRVLEDERRGRLGTDPKRGLPSSLRVFDRLSQPSLPAGLVIRCRRTAACEPPLPFSTTVIERSRVVGRAQVLGRARGFRLLEGRA